MNDAFYQALPETFAVMAFVYWLTTLFLPFFCKRRTLLLSLAFFGNLVVGSLPCVVASYLSGLHRSLVLPKYGLGTPAFLTLVATIFAETVYAFKSRRA